MGDDTCSIEGCDRPRWARTWCNPHYQLWRRNGAPEQVKGRNRLCAVSGCTRPARARDWCRAHYQRWYVSGSPGSLPVKRSRSLVESGRKTCGTCGTAKPLADFNRHPHGSGGVGANCRLCLAAASAAWFATNSDYRAQWRSENSGAVLDATHRRRALRAGADAERIDPTLVFERDDFTCRLCSEPIDMAAHKGAPLSPSLDHVIPLTRGGSHTYANVQAAHLYCNVSKGNRDAPLTRPSQFRSPDPG